MECSGSGGPSLPRRHPLTPLATRAFLRAQHQRRTSHLFLTYNSEDATLEPVQVYILNSDQCRFTYW